MTLLNGILALGALAFTVPLVIHLLFRSRFRTIEWGAMHLLDSVVRINRRRIQLMHLLLLLLRCMLPVLLAFCLARPVLTGFRSLPGDAPQSIVIAIDDSRSMSARDETGLTRMDRAKHGLTELLEKLSRRDEVILLPSSRIGLPASVQGVQEALRGVRELTSSFGPVDLGTLMRAAIEAADGASHPQRRILVVGDFPSHVVEDAAMSSLSRVASTLEEKSIRPAISFWNLGTDSNQLENVSVDELEIDSPAVVSGRMANFSASLRNASDIPIRDLRILWSINGQELHPTTITIEPRSSVTSGLNHRIEEVGVHELTVAIEHADALLDDNRRSIAVDVIREIHVMLVDGDPSRQPLEGETDYLAVALSPFAFGGEEQPDAVRTSIIRPSQMEREIQEQSPDIVVLANVAQILGKARESLVSFVNNGGSLILFDGDRIDVDSYNEPWSAEDATWNLPARLGPWVGSINTQDGPPLPIGGRNPLYSPWDILGEADQQPFADVDIHGYRQLSVDASVTENPDASDTDDDVRSDSAPRDLPIVLWTAANGDPLAVSATRGLGRVVQFAIAGDTASTTLPLRMVYLPMMQQLVLDLAGSRKQTNVDIGDGFSVPVTELAAQIPEGQQLDKSRPATYWLEPPGGPEIEIRPREEPTPHLAVARTEAPGPYRLRKETPLQDSVNITTSTMRLVEVPAMESRLRDADPSRLAAAADLMGANVYTEIESLQSDDQHRRFGREIWRWLLVALLVVLVAELLLQQRSVKASRLGAS